MRSARLRTITAIAIITIAAFFATLTATATAFAETEDNTPPQIISASISPDTVSKPGTVRVSIEAKDLQTGVVEADVYLGASDYQFGSERDTIHKTEQLDHPVYSGTIIFDVDIPSNVLSGKWQITGIALTDQAGNVVMLARFNDRDQSVLTNKNDDTDVIVAPTFVIEGSNENEDITPPQLLDIKIKDNSLTVKESEVVEVELSLKEEESGIKKIEIQAYSANSMGQVSGGVEYESDGPKTGNLVVPLTNWLGVQSGEWTIINVRIWDFAGNVTLYGGAPGEMMTCQQGGFDNTMPSPVFHVVANENDMAAPNITTVKLLNENGVAYRPGAVKLSVSVDDESEIWDISAMFVTGDDKEESVGVRMWGGLTAVTDDGDHPFKPGTFELNIPATTDNYTGSYRLDAIEATDVNNNRGAWFYNKESGQLVNEATGSTLPGITLELKDEFDFGAITSLTNPDLVPTLESLQEGCAARVMIDGSGILPAEAFEAIRGTDKTLVCYKDAYQWIINGLDVTNEAKDIDLSVSIDKDDKPRNFIHPIVNLRFASNGELPAKAQVRFKSDYLYSFKDIKGALRLFYDNGEELTQENSDFDLVFDGTDKWCYATITHNSHFVVSPYAIATFSEIIEAAVGAASRAAQEGGMTDLDPTAWYMGGDGTRGGYFPDTDTLYLDYAITCSLMSGFTDSNGNVTGFGPNRPLTRAQAATVIYRMARSDISATTDPSCYENNSTGLADVEDKAYYTAAVNWAFSKGIITGYVDKNGRAYAFGPDDPITREQLATIIGRYLDPDSTGNPSALNYVDAASISSWARAGVAYCAEKKIMSGIGSSGQFAPRENTSRCQMAKVISVTDALRH